MDTKPNLDKAVKTLDLFKYPKLVILEQVAGCNLKCSICPVPNLKRKVGIMRRGLYNKAINEIASWKSDTQVWPALMGESTLLGMELVKRIDYAKNKGIKEVVLNTNGNYDLGLNKPLLISGLDKIIFGIDAFTEETYKKIRVGGSFRDVKGNVFLAKCLGINTVVQFIVTEENKEEEEDFKEFWVEWGATVKVRRKLGWGCGVKTELEDINVERIPCPWLLRTISVHQNGNVCQCDNDYEGNYPVGNIETDTLLSCWNKLEDKRKLHWNKNFDLDLCRDCKTDWKCGLSDWYFPNGREGVE